MSYLIDTNVISEISRPKPNSRVVKWLNTLRLEEQFISVLSFGELRYGIERLNDAPRRERLQRCIEKDLPVRFGDRLLPITGPIADRWGRLRAEISRSIAITDSLLAATALCHDLRVATRNEKDFAAFPGLVVINPWSQ